MTLPSAPERPSLILLVDDSPTQAQRTRWVLEAAGFTVEDCPTAAMALASAAAHLPDLILLDIYLPDLSGHEVAQRLKADPLLAGIPIIFVTGVFRDVEDIIAGLAQGAVDYLCKPVDDGELIARVRATLRAKHTQRELGRLAQLLHTVNQVGNQLAGILDLALLLKTVVDLMHVSFGYPHIHLYLVEGSDLVLTAAAGEGAAERLAAAPRVPLAHDSLAATSARHQQMTAPTGAHHMRHPFMADVRAGAAMPLRCGGVVSGVLEIVSRSEIGFGPNDVLVLQTLADLVAVAVQNARLYRQMEALAMVDELTGLLNRRTLLARLETEWTRCQRYKHDLSLVLIDVDQFKQVNDQHGHGGGDSVLQALARVMANVTRQVDTIGRLGGDEFLLILPETAAGGALAVAARLSRNSDALGLTASAVEPPAFTVSQGVAAWPATLVNSAADLLHAADQALYRAKAGGRHRVEA